MKVLGYVRVSSFNQKLKNNSIPLQTKKISEYCKLNDFESFILVGGKENFAHFQSAFFQSKDLGKFNENLTFHCTLFEKRTALKLPLPG